MAAFVVTAWALAIDAVFTAEFVFHETDNLH
jgi:hypothetical protein